MKIALINPPSPFLINERIFPNIGLVRVATALKKRGYDTCLVDMAGNSNQKIPQADVYGFSSTTPQFPYVYNIHEKIKKLYPNVHTVIGGPHASSLYGLKRKNIEDINIYDIEKFDSIFVGEAELDNVELIFKKGWQKAPLIKNLDDVEIPDRSLIDIKSYKFYLNNKITTSIQSQRGCPGKCTFCCGRDIEMYNRVRQHSPERVIKEINQLNKEYGYSSFQIYDDEVNINMNRLEKLCIELSKKQYQFRAFIRNDQITKHPESVKWMKKAGFIKLCGGIESGSNRILKILNKQMNYKMNLNARRLIGKENIHYEGFMILGHPSETLDDIKLSKKWLLEASPDDFDLNILTPYPGSKIYNESIPSTKFKEYKWEWNGLYFNKNQFSKHESYYKGLDRQSKSDVRTDTLSNKDLINLRNDIEEEVKIKLNIK